MKITKRRHLPKIKDLTAEEQRQYSSYLAEAMRYASGPRRGALMAKAKRVLRQVRDGKKGGK